MLFTRCFFFDGFPMTQGSVPLSRAGDTVFLTTVFFAFPGVFVADLARKSRVYVGAPLSASKYSSKSSGAPSFSSYI